MLDVLRGNGQVPGAALLLAASGTQASSAFPDYGHIPEEHHPEPGSVRWSRTPHRQRGGL